MFSTLSWLSDGLSRPTTSAAPRRQPRRRRQRTRGAANVERLESRALLAVDVLAPITAQSLTSGDTATKLDLTDYFDETAVTGTVVEFTNNSIVSETTFYVELFDKAGPARTRTTPLTAANFLSYVDAGTYDGSMIHRSVLDFVVQGGGYYAPTKPADQVGSNPTLVPQGPTVANEPGNSNVFGTIAMAKLGGLPDSATNQWFFNMKDNTSILDPQNGGFTAFGRVLGAGMDAVGALGEAQVYDATTYYGDSAFGELPLWNSPAENANIVRPEDFLTFTSIKRGSENIYTVSSSAVNIVTASLDGTNLVLTPGQFSGTAAITVRATSVVDASFKELTFNVNVSGGAAAPALEDVMTFTSNGLWLLQHSDGVEFTQSTFAVWNSTVQWDAVLEGDFNGDGLTDVAGRTSIGQWWASINNGDGTAAAPKLMIYWKPSLNIVEYVVGDFNGDGRDDVAGISSNNVWWAGLAKSDSIGFTNSRMGAWAPTLDFKSIQTGDFDGDEQTDIAGLSTTGTWVGLVGKSTGGWESKTLGTWSPTLNFTDDILSGDFNGDGRTDIAGRAASGTWYLATANSGTVGFTNSILGGWSTSVSWSSVNVGDFNGDGKADIVARSNIGQWWGLLSNSTTDGLRGNTHIGYWNPNVVWTGIGVADADGDGREDIIGRVATAPELARGRVWVGTIVDGGMMQTNKWGFQSVATTVETRNQFFANF
jgi:cyclophilin family peptidyl-prolyl cis-trans isomerase